MTTLSDFSKSGRLGQNAGIPSQFTRHLEELQRRVPIVGDKALLTSLTAFKSAKTSSAIARIEVSLDNC
jgi:hypothetical protein